MNSSMPTSASSPPSIPGGERRDGAQGKAGGERLVRAHQGGLVLPELLGAMEGRANSFNGLIAADVAACARMRNLLRAPSPSKRHRMRGSGHFDKRRVGRRPHVISNAVCSSTSAFRQRANRSQWNGYRTKGHLPASRNNACTGFSRITCGF